MMLPVQERANKRSPEFEDSRNELGIGLCAKRQGLVKKILSAEHEKVALGVEGRYWVRGTLFCSPGRPSFEVYGRWTPIF
ncbi:hypothetical protein HN873_044560 [Arachis hypogaea]